MVKALLDSNIVVDLLRKHSIAENWLKGQTELGEDFEWATERMTQYGLRYDIDPLDYLIAAASYRLQLPLYTRNLKYMLPLLGSLTLQPY